MINLFEPKIAERAITNIKDVFESKWLGRGSYVTKFEAKLHDFTGLNIRMISCATDAIFGILSVMKFAEGSEIILPTNSFPAVISAIVEMKLCPVIVDIEPNGNISVSSLLNALSPKTSAIFLTHYGGTPVDVKSIRNQIPEHVKIFEDSACAFGTFATDGHVGFGSDFSLYSFDAMKLLTAGEGGGFTTKDDELFETLKSYFYLGLPSSEKSGLDASKSKSRWWEYNLERVGVRSVFTNLNAAIGLAQFENLQHALTRKADIYSYYKKSLRNVDILDQGHEEVPTHSNYFFTISSKRRDDLAAYLLANGVYTSLRYSNLADMSLYRGCVRGTQNSDVEKIVNLINVF
jgi:aminotransferase